MIKTAASLLVSVVAPQTMDEPQRTLKPLLVLEPQVTDDPHNTDSPFVRVPHNTDVPHTIDVPHVTEPPHKTEEPVTRYTFPLLSRADSRRFRNSNGCGSEVGIVQSCLNVEISSAYRKNVVLTRVLIGL